MKKKWLISSLITLALIGSFFIGQQFSPEVAARSSTFWRSLLLKTGQITSYFIGDDGDRQKGITKAYQVNTTNSQSGNATVDSPHYAAATISFNAAANLIVDSANGLATVLLGDTIRIRGSGSNESVLIVTVANGANNVVVNGPVVSEAAGNYITLSKRASHSNNTVKDLNTGLEWARYVQVGKIGPASDGKLNWYDTAKCFTLHVADAHVAIIAGNILRIDGSDQSARFFAGQVLVCSGFTNAVNNLPGLPVTSVSYTGGNTDIVVNSGNQILIPEAAGGSRDIKVVCQNMFAYVAAVNASALGGYTNWRVADDVELFSLRDMEQPTAAPDAVAFPGWPTSDYFWSATTHPNYVDFAMLVIFSYGYVSSASKTSPYFVALVRGG